MGVCVWVCVSKAAAEHNRVDPLQLNCTFRAAELQKNKADRDLAKQSMKSLIMCDMHQVRVRISAPYRWTDGHISETLGGNKGRIFVGVLFIRSNYRLCGHNECRLDKSEAVVLTCSDALIPLNDLKKKKRFNQSDFI